MKIAILGAGAWGSALAVSFSAQHEVRLWTRSTEDCARLVRERVSRYLPDVHLPEGVRVEADFSRAVAQTEVVIVATSTAGLRPTLEALAAGAARPDVIWACKGFEATSGALPHQIVNQVLPWPERSAALSGPSFALEVARGQPTAVVLAAHDAAFAARLAAALNSSRLRLYSSDDLVGVELGGALKNVVAIAAGISDGLGLGLNARAALITRGLAEMARLGVAMGGRRETFSGLAGLGDLALTCTGGLSRNREVGVRLASGAPLDRILAELGHVAEGVRSAEAVREHARRSGVEMPICEAVCSVLFESRPAGAAVAALLARDPARE